MQITYRLNDRWGICGVCVLYVCILKCLKNKKKSIKFAVFLFLCVFEWTSISTNQWHWRDMKFQLHHCYQIRVGNDSPRSTAYVVRNKRISTIYITTREITRTKLSFLEFDKSSVVFTRRDTFPFSNAIYTLGRIKHWGGVCRWCDLTRRCWFYRILFHLKK